MVFQFSEHAKSVENHTCSLTVSNFVYMADSDAKFEDTVWRNNPYSLSKWNKNVIAATVNKTNKQKLG